jgi:hypothetical protein
LKRNLKKFLRKIKNFKEEKNCLQILGLDAEEKRETTHGVNVMEDLNKLKNIKRSLKWE